MLNIRVEIKGDKKAVAQLKNIISAFSDWKPELEAVGDYLKNFYQNPVFETEGGIFNRRWQPLQPAYAIRKATKWPGRGILEASGRMRKSYETKVFSNMLSLINPTEYAAYHQEGRGVPERVLIEVDQTRKNEIVDIFKKGAIIKIQKAIKAG
jgi:phage gpG-like protein